MGVAKPDARDGTAQQLTAAAPYRRASALTPLGPVAKALHKGQQTRSAILDVALSMASRVGLEGLSMGALAERMGMSKSGVFAHFGSREDLQIAVIHEHQRRFEAGVFRPAIGLSRGLPRLRALFGNWAQRIVDGDDLGCLYIAGAVEFDDRAGAVRDTLLQAFKVWQAAISRAVRQAIEEKHLRPDADIGRIAFEMHGLILALHYEARFLGDPQSHQRALLGLDDILARYRA